MKKKPTPRRRKSYDKKLAALAPHEQMHQLFHGRPNDGGYFESSLRKLAKCRAFRDLGKLPKMNEPVVTLKDGAVTESRTLAESNAEEMKAELRMLTAHCGAALTHWRPETFEQIAAIMRMIEAENSTENNFNPFLPACGMVYERYVRARILSAARTLSGKKLALNQWRLACELENTNLNPFKQSPAEFSRTNSTRKTIGNICKRLKIPSRIGRPKLER